MTIPRGFGYSGCSVRWTMGISIATGRPDQGVFGLLWVFAGFAGAGDYNLVQRKSGQIPELLFVR